MRLRRVRSGVAGGRGGLWGWEQVWAWAYAGRRDWKVFVGKDGCDWEARRTRVCC